MKKVFFLMSLIIVFCCKDKKSESLYPAINKSERKFPDVKNLSDYPNTEFVASLDHNISITKNVIYASTMPYAWENIKNKLGQLVIENPARELQILNSSKSHINSLKPYELELEVKIEDSYIYSKAYFKKSLPFIEKLIRFDSPLDFKGKKVENFGFEGWPFSANTQIRDIFNILYYKDNNDFVFNLLSKDKQHEIIICKSKNLNAKKLKELVDEVLNKIELGKNEKQKDTNYKLYHYNSDIDVVKIPVYNFNIDYNFSSLEKKYFFSKNKEYKTEMIYQRNAFILDEYGSIIESKTIDSAAAAVEEIQKEIPKPKLFILDNNFILIAKRKDSKNPYFVLLNRNSELMINSKE